MDKSKGCCIRIKGKGVCNNQATHYITWDADETNKPAYICEEHRNFLYTKEGITTTHEMPKT